ncbi:glycerophosphodiester phosphodiesterase family protein [Gleimia hominis]|uniref:glycerophosphodiester phosphodiesterase family protein n=1 Tax=Gleimia hominis TaxID=595468 RepID=UPI001E493566|nr:glycerophosphodiester phosphodiesterase family protein [Gleimia hominis]WIK64810.1 glycerophosphodiester phosphodiesterase family protein [Gleimia hominis]
MAFKDAGDKVMAFKDAGNNMYARHHEPIIIAHRGGGFAPENSWTAFSRAIDDGFSYIETDAHVTADGRVVLIHDPFVGRVTTGAGLVKDFTHEALRKLKLTGEPGCGVRPCERPIPLLEEVLEAFPHARFNVDAKEPQVVEPLARIARKYPQQLCLASFEVSTLRRLRKAVGSAGVVTSLASMEVAQLVLAAQLTVPPSWLSVPAPTDGVVAVQVPLSYRGVPVVTPRFVASAHKHGLAVHVWTLNSVPEIHKALTLGVDGIVTDKPRLARTVLRHFQAQPGSHF